MLILAIVYFVLIAIYMWADFFMTPGIKAGATIVKFKHIMYRVLMVDVPIILLLVFKLVCEIIYKIVRALEIYIERNSFK